MFATTAWGLDSILAVASVFLCACRGKGDEAWTVLDGLEGPGKGKHIVFVTGDEEYRSEESMPQMAKILAVRHGFKCTVLFAINKDTGEIDPETLDNIPGLAALDTADLMVLFTRFRELPDEQMKHIIEYTESGKPIIGLRTATHAFRYVKRPDCPYAKYSFDSKSFEGGYGRQVLGETWVAHHGDHNKESTRGMLAPAMENQPIVRGCEDIWGPSDVYALTTLTGDSQPLILGRVLRGMKPEDEANPAKKPLPVAWIKTYTGARGNPARVFTTTMGHSFDFNSDGFRRLLVNACYWCLGLEDGIPARNEAGLVGVYAPHDIGNGKHVRGVKPADHALRNTERGERR